MSTYGIIYMHKGIQTSAVAGLGRPVVHSELPQDSTTYFFPDRKQPGRDSSVFGWMLVEFEVLGTSWESLGLISSPFLGDVS